MVAMETRKEGIRKKKIPEQSGDCSVKEEGE